MLLIGNIGLAQVREEVVPKLVAALDRVGANALAVHINPLQEAMQAGGDTDFTGSLQRLGWLATELDYPVMVKEVGHGIGAAAAQRLRGVPIAAIDVAGAGGTSWARVEQVVRYGEVRYPAVADWGIPTAQALMEVRRTLPGMPVVASGACAPGWTPPRPWRSGPMWWRWHAHCWPRRSSRRRPWSTCWVRSSRSCGSACTAAVPRTWNGCAGSASAAELSTSPMSTGPTSPGSIAADWAPPTAALPNCTAMSRSWDRRRFSSRRSVRCPPDRDRASAARSPR